MSTRAMAVVVRDARVSDAGGVARLMAQLGYQVSEADAGARLSRILSKPDHHFLVADDNGNLVGWVHASLSEHIDTDTCVLIEGLVVEREYRGRGIGKLLLSRAEQWTRSSGCSIVRLRSTAARTEAHRFYEHLGYTKIKTQFSYAKAMDPSAQATLGRLVPRVEQ